MDAFENIDRTLQEWCDRKGIDFFIEVSPVSRRYFYRSFDNGNVFQIVFEPEKQGKCRIDLHLIESSDDDEFHFFVESAYTNISIILNLFERSMIEWSKNR